MTHWPLLIVAQAPAGAIEIIATNYGPIGFGLISVLILWKVVVQPAMDRNRVDLDAVKSIASQMYATAEATKTVVARLEALATRMERNGAAT